MALIIRFAGADHANTQSKARELRRHLDLTFAPDQRSLSLDLEDARSDAASMREEAVLTAAVALGTGIGVALALRPEMPPEKALRFGAAIAGAVLALDDTPYTDQQDLACRVADAVGQVLASLGRGKTGSTTLVAA